MMHGTMRNETTNLSENSRVETRSLEEFDGKISSDDAEAVTVGLLEELPVNTLFFGRQIEIVLTC